MVPWRAGQEQPAIEKDTQLQRISFHDREAS
jgi:hypothetical protein